MWRFLPICHSCPRNCLPLADSPLAMHPEWRFGVELVRNPTQIYVCTTCRTAEEPLEPKSARAGARLFAQLNLENNDQFEIIPVECLSVCKRPCTVSFAAKGKWTYIYGDLPADTSAHTILTGAALYTNAPTP
eukprot:gene6217-6284_t